ncbi:MULTISPECIES: restriction endonuclease subunit S [Enterobacteriaceae]|uniref:restriction endonuclease subunit S n=1 Tax=Enterobacteriaceae TaxID=543 RepID=UPI000C99BB8F|nr:MULTISPECIES: restriction endonuclease subunit S [Klebsiella]MBG2646355.1 restriction endonuclease subunit S [Klebsiella michiganensis]MDH1761923.1 restriction endonuclease subunit S [Klebsiella michiganensis]MDO9682300.1 restriction endonuclease subunit S [Klebsiella oxytoca]WKM79503.1 restriction endonuclease subunit S [Klebsiella oxytoca]WPI53124.1 restriction endonuclease subunit S [Klebsiella oxytoca]
MVPKLRFSQFHSPWCTKTLGEVGEIISGLTYSPENIRNSGLLVLRSSNIQSGRLCFEDCVYVDLIVDDEKKTRKNDILICVRNGSRSLIGKNTLIKEIDQETTHGAFMTVFRGPLNGYVAQLLQTKKFYSQVYSDLGATINSINGGNLKRYSFSFPSDFNETAKVADFLSYIDDKIMLLDKQHKQLCQYKKSIVQNIFSKKLRFKDENGKEFPEWHLVRLGDYLIKHNEKSTENNQYPVLTSSREGIYFQKDYFNGEDIASKNNIGYNVVPKGYFTYRHMSDDLVFKFNINTLCDKGIVSTLYPVFTTKLNAYFLQLKLNEGKEFRDYAIQQKQGGSRTYMYYSKLETLKLMIPNIAEQTKIANLISAFDDKIAAKKTELDKLKTWKQGLLQQMLV